MTGYVTFNISAHFAPNSLDQVWPSFHTLHDIGFKHD